MANLSVSGAVSGIDTASLITSLVQAQSNQQTLLKTQQKTQQAAADAMTKLSTALTSAAGLAAGVAKTSAWVGATATSTSASVTVTPTGTASGSLTFDVARLAAAHALVSSDAVSSTAAVVSGSGFVSLTAGDGSVTELDVGGGTLAEVVNAVNGAGKGVVATAVQTSPGQYRLQVTSTTTGAASEFSLDGVDGFTSLDVLTQASDAALRIGSIPATAYELTSPTNTFTGVLPGASVTVSKLETGVTVQSKIDGSAVADQVGKLVDAVNGVLSQIRTATAYNTATGSKGPLVGDSTVRTVQQQLLETVGRAGAAGVRLTRDGNVTFDRQAFLTAFAADPAAVGAAFGAGVTFEPEVGVSGTVALSSSTTATQPGTYAVEVTQRAAREQWSLPAGTFEEGAVVQLYRGDTAVTYTVGPLEGPAEVAAALSGRATAAGFGVSASADADGNLVLTADSAGSAFAFVADVDDLGFGSYDVEGVDAEGTIDGQQATGVGDVLTLPTGTGGAVGLALDTSRLTDADVGGLVGSVTFAPGLASALSTLVDRFTATNTGALSTAAKGRQASVTTLQTQIDDWDRRLAAYRLMLTQQFTAMETAIATLKSQTSSISALVNASTTSSSS